MNIVINMAYTKPADLIEHDDSEDAVEVSRDPSDGEDPVEDHPKISMQTSSEKDRQKRHLETEENQTQRPSPFDKLPSELILKVMQHTHITSLRGFVNSSKINRSIFDANSNAIFRGMEIEQFSEWKWLFGDSNHRTPTQSQYLKGGFINSVHWWREERGIEVLQMINDNRFTSQKNVMFLQTIQNCLDMDMQAAEAYMATKIARRTAMCLRAISFSIPSVLEDDGDFVTSITTREQPWEVRSQLITEQAASIRAEIRSVLQALIGDYFHTYQFVMMLWTSTVDRIEANHRQPQELKRWMSNLLTGYVLKDWIPRWSIPPWPRTQESLRMSYWDASNFFKRADFIQFLASCCRRPRDGIRKISHELEFAKSIGLDVDGLVEGSELGEHIDKTWD